MAALMVAGIEETLYYYAFPREHWGSLRTNNPLERLLREVRRRTMRWERFPDGKSALMLATARLRHVAGAKWRARRYVDIEPALRRAKQSQDTPAQKLSPPPRGSRAEPGPMTQQMCEKLWTTHVNGVTRNRARFLRKKATKSGGKPRPWGSFGGFLILCDIISYLSEAPSPQPRRGG